MTRMSDFRTRWLTKSAERYAAEVEAGLHDGNCEHTDRVLICHCSKRRREAAGYTVPPGPLEWLPPLCPRYDEYTVHNGDSVGCQPCLVTWDERGAEATFTDDHGDAFDKVRA